jgi:serine phosphatase RsbU (regulator of sigma subunit)
MCSRQIDIAHDAHFATVLVGVGDLASRTITIANAGHLNPLLTSASGSEFVATDVGPPLGVGPTAYTPTTFTMPHQSTLLVFTDGLVERRGEHIDLGLQRLAEAATAPDQTVEQLLTGLLSHVAGDGSEDDIAILAFRWVGRSAEQRTAR